MSAIKNLAKQMVRDYPSISYQQVVEIQKDRRKREFKKIGDFRREKILRKKVKNENYIA